MPELPEVQTVINTLNDSTILNKTIIGTDVFKSKLLKNSTPKKFNDFLLNEKIKIISRKGKYLVFHLSNDKILLIHLRLEGKLFYEKNDNSIEQSYLRIKINFKNNYSLLFYDSRMFGTFNIFTNEQYNKSSLITKLGLDPFDPKLTVDYLSKRFNKSSRPIKSTLLDQTIIAGIGNIYADEILYACHIHPLTKTNALTKEQIKSIINNTKSILTKAIKYGGTTISTFKSSSNHIGQYQKFLKVHGNKNMKKIKVNGRGTYYDPKTQVLK